MEGGSGEFKFWAPFRGVIFWGFWGKGPQRVGLGFEKGPIFSPGIFGPKGGKKNWAPNPRKIGVWAPKFQNLKAQPKAGVFLGAGGKKKIKTLFPGPNFKGF